MKGRLFVGAGERRGEEPALPRVLFGLLGPPVLWALHLAASYFVVTLDCVSDWSGAGWSLAVLTVLMGGGALWAGWAAWQGWRALGPGEDGEWDWDRTLLLAGVAGSLLFTLVIVAEGVAPAFVSMCR